MIQNLGKKDKAVRVLLALFFLYLGYYYSIWWYVLTVFFFIEALSGYCIFYRILGINTNKPAKKSKKKRK